MGVIILVEGLSDKAALEVIAARRGDREVPIVAMGGATNVRRFAARYGPHVAGLCDISERRDFIQAGITPFTCVADLENEPIRALGGPAVEAVDLARVPAPLTGVLDAALADCPA